MMQQFHIPESTLEMLASFQQKACLSAAYISKNLETT